MQSVLPERDLQSAREPHQFNRELQLPRLVPSLKQNRGKNRIEVGLREGWGKPSFHLFWQEEKCHHLLHHLPVPAVTQAAHDPYGRKRMMHCPQHGPYGG